jgi:hypothetical protein
MADLQALLALVDELRNVLAAIDHNAAPEVLSARRNVEDLTFNLTKLAEAGLIKLAEH